MLSLTEQWAQSAAVCGSNQRPTHWLYTCTYHTRNAIERSATDECIDATSSGHMYYATGVRGNVGVVGWSGGGGGGETVTPVCRLHTVLVMHARRNVDARMRRHIITRYAYFTARQCSPRNRPPYWRHSGRSRSYFSTYTRAGKKPRF